MKRIWHAIGIIIFWLIWPYLLLHFAVTGKRARILLFHDNKVLLVRTWIGPGRFELPGGGIHHNETPQQAAVRELKEEVGLVVKVEDLKPLYESQYRDHGLRTTYICYSATFGERPNIKVRKPEITSFMWVSPSDIDPRKVNGGVQSAVKAYEASLK